MESTHLLARVLGWFSIGLGVAEMTSGVQMDEYFGTGDQVGTWRFFGLREVAAGAIILAQKKPSAPSVWSRVGGDVMDLIFLGTALEAQRSRAKRERLTAATLVVAGVTAVDVYCAWKLGRLKG